MFAGTTYKISAANPTGLRLKQRVQGERFYGDNFNVLSDSSTQKTERKGTNAWRERNQSVASKEKTHSLVPSAVRSASKMVRRFAAVASV